MSGCLRSPTETANLARVLVAGGANLVLTASHASWQEGTSVDSQRSRAAQPSGFADLYGAGGNGALYGSMLMVWYYPASVCLGASWQCKRHTVTRCHAGQMFHAHFEARGQMTSASSGACGARFGRG
jgi:hypothetical protein